MFKTKTIRPIWQRKLINWSKRNWWFYLGIIVILIIGYQMSIGWEKRQMNQTAWTTTQVRPASIDGIQFAERYDELTRVEEAHICSLNSVYCNEKKENEKEPVYEVKTAKNAEIREIKPIYEGAVGKASWYGEQFHGNLTANGEVYDMNAMTAAHKHYPFGTRLEVTNLKNNKSVVVRINDRGPFVAGRDLDLSRAAFDKIGNLGSGTIDIKIKEL